MNYLDRAGYTVLRKNRCLLCSTLDACELLPAATSLGLLTHDECEEVRRATGKSTAKFLDILLERRRSTAQSPTEVQNATDGRRSASGEVNTFKLLVQVLEVKEEYKSWANYLQGECEIRLYSSEAVD